MIRILFILLLTGCAGKAIPDFSGNIIGGKLAVKLQNRNLTTCKKVIYTEEPEYGYDEVLCLEIFTKKQYVVSAKDWEEIVKFEFGLYSHKEIVQWVGDKEFICNEIDDLCIGDYESLKVLKEFIYEE